MGIRRLPPFVDPGETMPPPFRELADRRQHGRRLQAIQSGLETIVIARAAAPSSRPTLDQAGVLSAHARDDPPPRAVP